MKFLNKEEQRQELKRIRSYREKIAELEHQNEVLSDTVSMLSPLMMENKKLKDEVMNLRVKIINLEQEKLSELY